MSSPQTLPNVDLHVEPAAIPSRARVANVTALPYEPRMRHRLPLATPAAAEPPPWQHPPRRLSGPSVGIADTERGLLATQFALEFAEAGRARGVSMRVTLLDFVSAPALPATLAERLAACATELRARRFDADVWEEDPAGAGAELWVGAPALVALAPALSILLGSDRPRHTWPESLRERAQQCQLAMAEARPGVARALVDALCDRGFLPAGGLGVR